MCGRVLKMVHWLQIWFSLASLVSSLTAGEDRRRLKPIQAIFSSQDSLEVKLDVVLDLVTKQQDRIDYLEQLLSRNQLQDTAVHKQENEVEQPNQMVHLLETKVPGGLVNQSQETVVLKQENELEPLDPNVHLLETKIKVGLTNQSQGTVVPKHEYDLEQLNQRVHLLETKVLASLRNKTQETVVLKQENELEELNQTVHQLETQVSVLADLKNQSQGTVVLKQDNDQEQRNQTVHMMETKVTDGLTNKSQETAVLKQDHDLEQLNHTVHLLETKVSALAGLADKSKETAVLKQDHELQKLKQTVHLLETKLMTALRNQSQDTVVLKQEHDLEQLNQTVHRLETKVMTGLGNQSQDTAVHKQESVLEQLNQKVHLLETKVMELAGLTNKSQDTVVLKHENELEHLNQTVHLLENKVSVLAGLTNQSQETAVLKQEHDLEQLNQTVHLLETEVLASLTNQSQGTAVLNQAHDLEQLTKTVHLLETKVLEHENISRSIVYERKTSLSRSCEEIRSSNPKSPSSHYWIDPDGTGSGDPPIYVFCNMSTGSTQVMHDSETLTEVDRCSDRGCYSKNIIYQATLRQMVALTELSRSCRQFVQFDCFGVPLEFNGVPQGWWNDRNGEPQYHWAGRNSSVHTCQCGIDGNCDIPYLNCNCDSSAAADHSDRGYISSKELLPITRLNFGRTSASNSYARYRLGRLECTGRILVQGMPESCADLWKLGHTLNGFYNIRQHNGIQNVYCDFSHSPGDEDIQRSFGPTDVKNPVYFYVQRKKSFSEIDAAVTFEIERVNVGGGMNATSGVFTAPRSGTYLFVFSALKTSSISPASVSLTVNDDEVGSTWTPSISDFFPMALSSILRLNQTDEVKLILKRGALHDDKAHYTHFNGLLLQEDLF